MTDIICLEHVLCLRYVHNKNCFWTKQAGLWKQTKAPWTHYAENPEKKGDLI